MRAWILVLIVTAGLAGCADATEPVQDDGPEVQVTSTTGAIRGVVVDEAITPVAGVNVFLSNTGAMMETDDEGEFAFSNLEPGPYFVQVSKIGYQDVQISTIVEAGVERPPSVRILMPKIPGGDPFDETLKFDGFYECAFSLFFITDSCDMATRTIHDAGVTVVPRHVQNNINTAFYDNPNTTVTLIQEGFWDTSALPKFRASIADTPIDNLCDCSSTYLVVVSDTGYTYGRLDNEGSFPSTERQFAVRGFIPFAEEATEVKYAVNVKFEIFTSFFHNYTPAEGWNMLERDSFPSP